MGQTLSHGVYLPNEGERNCYAGLASNWQILNTAVGAIAEKAPLVHTHTVSQITDFPAYGNAAGTICEGNDSRLSDARTPVAHTHGKADITDLLNSNFIPSANNSYDLGSSSYQWNNAYIKSLTINGVACGDILTHNVSDFVDVSSNQTIGGVKAFSNIIYGLGNQIILKRNDVERTVLPASTVYTAFSFNDKSGVGVASRLSAVENVVKTNGDINLYLRAYDFSTKSNTHTTVVLERKYDGTSSFYPEQNNTVNLGTSDKKWKTLNGVNPGALSLPKIVLSESRTLDRTNWDYTGTTWNTLDTSAMTGWGYIYIEDCSATDYILIRRGVTDYSRPTQSANPILANDSKYYLYITFPIVQNTSVYALIKTSGTVKTSVVYPCQGNV